MQLNVNIGGERNLLANIAVDMHISQYCGRYYFSNKKICMNWIPLFEFDVFVTFYYLFYTVILMQCRLYLSIIYIN